MPKLASQNADFMFYELIVDSVWSLPFLCGGVSLSNSQRNILFTKVIWICPRSVLTDQSRNVYFSHK